MWLSVGAGVPVRFSPSPVFTRQNIMICTVTLNTAIDRVLLAPGFMPGQHVKVRVRSLSPAGKGINVARGLARLGVGAVCCGFVGENQLPFFRNSLAEETIECMLTPCEAETRTNTTILDPAGKTTTTHLREPGFEITKKDLKRLESDLQEVLEKKTVETAAFCGSLHDGMETSDCLRLLDLAGEGDRQVVLDIGGEQGRELLESGKADLVKPNLEELRQYLHRDIAAEKAPEAAAELLRFVDTVLLTLGGRGACLIAEDTTLKACCKGSPESVSNTVGCGDAFLAGWLYGAQAGFEPAESLACGVACGTASARTETTADYDSNDVRFFMENCVLSTGF